MNLVTFPSPHLSRDVSKPSLTLPELNEAFVAILQDADFVRVENTGVAIAANQVADLRPWWVMQDGETACGIIQPTVSVPENTRFERMAEGCLSFPGYYGLVARATSVRVQGVRVVLSAPVMPTEHVFEPFDEVWTGHNAQLAQHEFDHLNGICYTAHLSSAERSRIHGNMRKSKAKR